MNRRLSYIEGSISLHFAKSLFILSIKWYICIAPEDYLEESGLTLTFNSTVLSINISVAVIDDNIVEGNQSFFGNLLHPVGPVTLDPDVTTVTIVDDPQECKYLCIIIEINLAHGQPYCEGCIEELSKYTFLLAKTSDTREVTISYILRLLGYPR